MNEFNYKLIDDDANETVIVRFPAKLTEQQVDLLQNTLKEQVIEAAGADVSTQDIVTVALSRFYRATGLAGTSIWNISQDIHF